MHSLRKVFALTILALTLGAAAIHSASAQDSQNPQAAAQTVSSFDAFRKIPVLQDGRIKPLETHARTTLLQFSGRGLFEGQSSVEWLARLLFTPEQTKDDKIFLINNPEIPMAMGAQPDKKRRYSFAQLEGGYQKLFELARAASEIESRERSAVEQEILRVYGSVTLYLDLSRVFAFARPHPDFTITEPELKQQLHLPADPQVFSFLDIALRANHIELITRGLEETPSDQWNAAQKETLGLLSNLYQWSLQYKNLPFLIVPSFSSDREEWLSPWDAIAAGFQTQSGREELSLLQEMRRAYVRGHQVEFDLAVQRFKDSVIKRVSAKQRRAVEVIPLELTYNKANFFFWSKLFYFAAFFIFLFSLLWPRPVWYRLGVGLVAAGLAAHLTALVFRITILARPPVSNLYETFIFVGLISVIIGLIVEKFNRKWLGIVIASVCGLVFLLIAGKYSAEGDTMQMLIAVLNSNFWLSTHVTSITIGYAGACVAGVVGHVYIIQAITRPKDVQLLSSTYKNLIGILGFGLIMTFLGTMLGGVWADQSWGRFWGWDPKENGALLIVIWIAILFHARIGKMIGPLGVAAGSALGIIVVMWAWFGVNLLSVGLHSYGFTSGVATGLGLYVAAQLLFLGIAVPIAQKKLKTRGA